MACSLASNSRKTYSSGEKQYLNFCMELQIQPNQTLPANEKLLIYFATYMARFVKADTIKVYLAAIRYLHIINGHNLNLQSFLRLQYVIKGIKCSQGGGGGKWTRLPITLTHLRLFQLLLSKQTFDNTMLWAALTLAFFGFLRVSEFTSRGKFNPHSHLSPSDIVFKPSRLNPNYMQINIKVSKTDPFRSGIKLTIGKTGSTICPVQAMLKYMSVIPHTEGPLFQLQSGTPLTRNNFTSLTRNLLRQMGINSHEYASHSFRIGAATCVGAANMPSWLIKTLGRWTSDCYQQYIKVPVLTLCHASKLLATSTAQPITG